MVLQTARSEDSFEAIYMQCYKLAISAMTAHHNGRLHANLEEASVSNHNGNTKWNKVALTATAWTAQTSLAHR